jgi:hypothetical protein
VNGRLPLHAASAPPDTIERYLDQAHELGASIGIALAGAVLIPTLTSSVLSGLAGNSGVRDSVTATASVELASGVPFTSDRDLRGALDAADVPPDTIDAIVDDNTDARSTRCVLHCRSSP